MGVDFASLPGLSPRMRELLMERARLEEISLLEDSFLEFTKAAWSQIEPGKLTMSWHIEALCEHMQAFADGQIEVLVVCMPPRHLKSTIVSVLYPDWRWAKYPELKFMMLTYGRDLSSQFAVKARRLIKTQWYEERWGDRFHIMEDQDTKMKYDTSAGGARFSGSVQGGVLGSGADEILIDDPHDTENVDSDTARKKTLDFAADTLTNRFNQPKKFRLALAMQRVHEDDLANRFIEKYPKAVKLILPEEFEIERRCTTIVVPTSYPDAWTDPRNIEGQLLCPEHFGEAELAREKGTMSAHGYAARYQQSPQPKSGGVFDMAWFNKTYDPARIETLRRECDIVQSWDTANKELQTSAFSVCTTWGVRGRDAYLLNVWREKVRTDVLETMAKGLSDAWRPSTILIEDKASGTGLINAMRRRSTDEFGKPIPGGASVVAIKISPKYGDKEHRAEVTGPFWSQGRGWLPQNAPWLPAWLQEHLRFPNTTYKDQVDSTSQFINWFTRLRLHSQSPVTSLVSIYQR